MCNRIFLWILAFVVTHCMSSCVSTFPLTPPVEEVIPTLKINQRVDMLLRNDEKITLARVRGITTDGIKVAAKQSTREIKLDSVRAIAPSYVKGRRQHVIVLNPKTTVRLKMRDGRKINAFSIQTMDESTLTGTADGKKQSIKRAEIETLVVLETDVGASIALTLTLIVVLPVVATWVIGSIAFSHLN